MLERKDFYKFIFFEYGEADYGSYKGMRYRVAAEPLKKLFGRKAEEKAAAKIRAYAWKEPSNYATATDKVFEDFEFSDDGVDDAIDWLNDKWREMCGK